MTELRRRAENEHKKQNLLGFEHILCDSADRANPIIGDIFKSGAGSDAGIRIPGGRVIYVTTNGAYILLHNKSPLICVQSFINRW